MATKALDLAALTEYIKKTEERFQEILRKLKWDEDLLAVAVESDDYVVCPHNRQHRVPRSALERHSWRCGLIKQGIDPDRVVLPESSDWFYEQCPAVIALKEDLDTDVLPAGTGPQAGSTSAQLKLDAGPARGGPNSGPPALGPPGSVGGGAGGGASVGEGVSDADDLLIEDEVPKEVPSVMGPPPDDDDDLADDPSLWPLDKLRLAAGKWTHIPRCFERLDVYSLERSKVTGWLISNLDRYCAALDMDLLNLVYSLILHPEKNHPDTLVLELHEFLAKKAAPFVIALWKFLIVTVAERRQKQQREAAAAAGLTSAQTASVADGPPGTSTVEYTDQAPDKAAAVGSAPTTHEVDIDIAPPGTSTADELTMVKADAEGDGPAAAALEEWIEAEAAKQERALEAQQRRTTEAQNRRHAETEGRFARWDANSRVTRYDRDVDRANAIRQMRADLLRNEIDLDIGSLLKPAKFDTPRQKSRLELLAEQRDYKRRRQSYRAKNVHITKRTPIQVARDIINMRMEELLLLDREGGFEAVLQKLQQNAAADSQMPSPAQSRPPPSPAPSVLSLTPRQYDGGWQGLRGPRQSGMPPPQQGSGPPLGSDRSQPTTPNDDRSRPPLNGRSHQLGGQREHGDWPDPDVPHHRHQGGRHEERRTDGQRGRGGDGERDRGTEHGRGREKDEDPSRDRQRDRGARDRDYDDCDRDRDRDHKRHRESDRSRKRDRDRERDRDRNRERERDRDKDQDRDRHRERGRDRDRDGDHGREQDDGGRNDRWEPSPPSEHRVKRARD